MAYDELLAERVADLLATESTLTEKKMFGGIAFMVQGNMAVGVSGDSLMVRVGKETYEEALAESGVDVLGPGGTPMTGWVLVAPERINDDDGLEDWVERGRQTAVGLPPK